MAVTLTLGNRYIQVAGADLKTTRAIEKACSYKVEGYYFSPAYRARHWDGKEHLFKHSDQLGDHAPSGMAQDIAELLRDKGIDYEVQFTTKIKAKRRKLKWAGKPLRKYQKEAVRAILGKPIPGRGVIKMPIRSGKTLTMARVIWNFGLPTLFVVPSKSLLHQTAKHLRAALPDAKIGKIGDGHYDPQFITVATIHTLAAMAPKRKTKDRDRQEAHPDYKRLMNMYDLACFDEAHHIRGTGSWYQIFMEINARFKIGLSATVFFDNKKEQERGIIWLRAACGPVRIDIPAGRLIREGFLLPQHVKMYKCVLPVMKRDKKWSATLKKKCITENPHRNRMLAELVQEHAPMKTIVIAKEHKHIAAICKELDSLDVDYRTITGRDSQDKRDTKIEGMVDGDYNVLIGNVLGEGIDIPAVECVVNAEGGKDEKATWQRQRNLTVSEDQKEPAVMIDIYDKMSPYFEKHSRARLKTYKSEKEFKVEVLEWDA